MRLTIAFVVVLSACSDPVPPSAAVAPTGAAYTIDQYQDLGTQPNSVTASLTAMSIKGDVDITISNLRQYCAPIPSFTVEQQADQLLLTLVRTAVVARCVGSHNMSLSLDDIDNQTTPINRVVIQDVDGNEIVSTGIARARG